MPSTTMSDFSQVLKVQPHFKFHKQANCCNISVNKAVGASVSKVCLMIFLSPAGT